MPLEPENQCHLIAAEGFLELGMFLDADAELDRIEADVRHVPEVLEMRVRVYWALARWDLMQTAAKALTRFNPDDVQATVSVAFATRRAESLEAAHLILLEAVERHPEAAILHYNLSCYECQLGQVEVAKNRLRRAITLDGTFGMLAVKDERPEAAVGFARLSPLKKRTTYFKLLSARMRRETIRVSWKLSQSAFRSI